MIDTNLSTGQNVLQGMHFKTTLPQAFQSGPSRPSS
jgi:hypothetical protein